ncbi:MAG: lipocalin-like domain-containing protein [Woeseia sp.]
MRRLIWVLVFAGIFLGSSCERARDEERRQASAASPRLANLLSPEDRRGYAQALEPRLFSFPADHGPHRSYRNEWWYLTGNLETGEGRRFGFELTFFRFSLAPAEAFEPGGPRSAWATNQVYIGHFAVTDVAARRFHAAERLSRGAVGLAGARAEPFQVWLEDWSLGVPQAPEAGQDSGRWDLRARDRGIELRLSLQPLKAPVLNGHRGLAQKSAEPGNASYYYSIPRLKAAGELNIGGEEHAVSGLAWLDREWGSSGLAQEQEGWDWFALQLSDGSDLMFYNLRRTDGRQDPHSAGTWTQSDGRSIHLSQDDVRLTVLNYWDSPQGGRYPMGWLVNIPRLALELQVEPVLRAQELRATVRYWEGAVDVSGRRGDRTVNGMGYVELTGYADEAAADNASPQGPR